MYVPCGVWLTARAWQRLGCINTVRGSCGGQVGGEVMGWCGCCVVWLLCGVIVGWCGCGVVWLWV